MNSRIILVSALLSLWAGNALANIEPRSLPLKSLVPSSGIQSYSSILSGMDLTISQGLVKEEGETLQVADRKRYRKGGKGRGHGRGKSWGRGHKRHRHWGRGYRGHRGYRGGWGFNYRGYWGPRSYYYRPRPWVGYYVVPPPPPPVVYVPQKQYVPVPSVPAPAVPENTVQVYPQSSTWGEDDRTCRYLALRASDGGPGFGKTVEGGIFGGALGAAAGAAIGAAAGNPGKGAAIGAAAGGFTGATANTLGASQDYDNAYAQCMAGRGY